MIKRLIEELNKRIVILDGPRGTMLQKRGLSEEDYRGEKFREHGSNLKGNHDILSITKPDVVEEIFNEYLNAGSDIIGTNTFNANPISQSDYGTEAYAYEMNYAAAKVARKAADKFTKLTPNKPRYVAGAIGPTNKTLSLSPKVSDPGFRAVTFDFVKDAYIEQARGLMDGGVDILLIETVFDTLNCKAALFGILELFEKTGKELPIMVSGTIVDMSGRTLSGQTIEAFWNSISHVKLLSVGVNCSLGAKEMRPYIEELSEKANVYISCYPNAGLPNAFGGYDEMPEETAGYLYDFAKSGFLNLVGGCCGTTPEHVKHIAKIVEGIPPRKIPEIKPYPVMFRSNKI